jgi:hypothetical protein
VKKSNVANCIVSGFAVAVYAVGVSAAFSAEAAIGNSTISLQRAIAIALTARPGVITAKTLEGKDDITGLRYSFDIQRRQPILRSRCRCCGWESARNSSRRTKSALNGQWRTDSARPASVVRLHSPALGCGRSGTRELLAFRENVCSQYPILRHHRKFLNAASDRKTSSIHGVTRRAADCAWRVGRDDLKTKSGFGG